MRSCDRNNSRFHPDRRFSIPDSGQSQTEQTQSTIIYNCSTSGQISIQPSFLVRRGLARDIPIVMILKSAHIKNCRSLRDVEVPFGKQTAILGGNRAGKSTILKALDRYYGASTSVSKHPTRHRSTACQQPWQPKSKTRTSTEKSKNCPNYRSHLTGEYNEKDWYSRASRGDRRERIQVSP